MRGVATAHKGFVSVNLPEEVIAQIDRYIEMNTWGYRSRPEVIVAAVRQFLKEEMSPP